MNTWQRSEPPKDGTPIVAIGRIICHYECSIFVEPFTAFIFWEKDSSGFEGWHFVAGGLSVARTLEDEVKIDSWINPPSDSDQLKKLSSVRSNH